MKIRMQDDAVRFRLNRRDVSEFARTGRASATIHFGTSQLDYTLAASSSATQLHASFNGSEICVEVPAAQAQHWTSTDTVGIDGTQALDGNRTLAIIIEKDFQCMHKGEEAKDPDAYPNPLATA